MSIVTYHVFGLTEVCESWDAEAKRLREESKRHGARSLLHHEYLARAAGIEYCARMLRATKVNGVPATELPGPAGNPGSEGDGTSQ